MTRVLVAMSGGVDSSVAAYLLQRQGFEVIGATIKTWATTECRTEKAKGCCSLRDVDDARAVAGKLGIPYYVLDLSDDFKEKVIDYFVDTYLEGRTPNPCIECNNHIKFGVFVKKAEELNCRYVATGHYARKIWDSVEQRWHLTEGVDANKDQSYVLFGLNQAQLQKTLFPVGEFTKDAIRDMAKELDLRVFDKPDSQEICFVPKHYSDVIKKQRADLPGKGKIYDMQGNVVGEHEGYFHYTIGQRKGIGSMGQDPRYVVNIRREDNAVIIGDENMLFSHTLKAQRMNWMALPVAGQLYDIKIRSRNVKSRGILRSFSESEAVFEFETPEKSVTPGQAAVFYNGSEVVGGGWIAL